MRLAGEEQRATLDDLRKASVEAAQIIYAAYPTEAASSPSSRLACHASSGSKR